jgi:hypothetical protein
MMEGEQADFVYDESSMKNALKYIDAMSANMRGNNLI